MKILISNAENRKTFDIINITLKYFNRESLIITSIKNDVLLNIIYSEIKLLRTSCYHLFETDLKKIIASIKDAKESIVYLPIEETTTLFFYDFINKNEYLRKKFYYLLPPVESYKISRNKYLINLFCIKNNIPVPSIINKTEIQVTENKFTPLIYKPKIGTGSNGIKIIRTKEELNSIVYDNNYFLQYFVGDGVTVDGGFYLMDKGELISFYGHQRIRTYPQEGGVSVFSKSIENNRIKAIGTQLLYKLNWSGWAMIEFMYDEKSDDYLVIEINPRAWGSILLSEINQSYFVIKYIRLTMGMQIKQISVNYDTYIRWLIPWDVILYIKKLGKIKNFWKLNIKNTAYIGFTYSNIIKTFLFILYSCLNLKNIRKIIR
jgi:predicted ATP-grasp superfamily ATP-dependent carboligase